MGRANSRGSRQPPDEAVDLYVDAPRVKVEEIDLEVDDLQAQVALLAGVAHSLRLNVGVSARLGKTRLTIAGVQAQARIEARLGNVTAILARVLTSLDHNPRLLRSVGQAVGNVGSGTRDVLEDTGDTVRGVGAGVSRLAPGDGPDG